LGIPADIPSVNETAVWISLWTISPPGLASVTFLTQAMAIRVCHDPEGQLSHKCHLARLPASHVVIATHKMSRGTQDSAL
jgi:hypothetical protein